MNNTNKGKFQKGQKAWNKGIEKIRIPEDVKIQIISDYVVNKLTRAELSIKYGYTEGKIYWLLRNLNLIRNVSEAKRGHSTSQETKNKISEANKGHPVSNDTRKAVSEANKKRTEEQLKIQVSKSWLTKKKNNTYNTSNPEEELYQRLLKENVNKTIYRNYKDKERYPYYCDFYIKEDDLFIELNAHWTHGGHPFNEFDPEDLKQLNEWKEKAKTSKFYQQAIYVWTELDVKKRECAKTNKLNYQTIY